MNEILTWRSIFGARGSTEGHLFLDVVDCVSSKVEPLEAVVKNRHGITTKMFDIGTGSMNGHGSRVVLSTQEWSQAQKTLVARCTQERDFAPTSHGKLWKCVVT